MRVLVLEDREERCREFRRRCPPSFDLTIATCAQGAIDALARQSWNIVFLDHDLNDECNIEFRFMPANTGMTVVRYLCCGPRAVGNIVIHSDNQSASRRMRDLLLAAGYHASRMPYSGMNWAEFLQV